MDKQVLKKLVDIKKLMDAAGSVGEAEAAAAAMQRLVLKHNVDAAELEALGQEEKEAYGGMPVHLWPKGKPGVAWRVYVFTTIAHYNFCTFVRTHSTGGDGVLIGQASNQEAVMLMYEAAVENFLRLAPICYKEAHAVQGWRISKPAVWKNSFLLGVPQGLHLKFDLERKAEIQADSKTSALVLVKDADLEKAVDDHFGRGSIKKTETKIQVTDKDAYRKGVEKGRSYDTGDRIDAGFLALNG